MKLRATILSLHAEVLQAKLQNTDWFSAFHRMCGHVADRQYLLPSKESLQLCADFLSTLPNDSTPVKLFRKRIESYLSRYSFFCREAQAALVAVEHVAGLAAAANLFGVNGRHTMPWQEAREAIAEASAGLDSYIDGAPNGVETFASMLDRLFELALACTNDPESDFEVGDEKTAELLRLRDALSITVLLEEL